MKWKQASAVDIHPSPLLEDKGTAQIAAEECPSASSIVKLFMCAAFILWMARRAVTCILMYILQRKKKNQPKKLLESPEESYEDGEESGAQSG